MTAELTSTELIGVNVNEETGDSIVSGRELHEKLKIKTPYKKWMDRMIDYGFAENVDFCVMDKNVQDETAFGGARKITDHIMKLDMAKEIAMIQRTPEGKAIRQYLIEIEKVWNSPEKIMERALIIANNNIRNLTVKVEELTPKAEVYDTFIEKEHTLGFRELKKEIISATDLNIKEEKFKEVLRALNLITSKKVKATSYAVRNGYAVTKDVDTNTGTRTQDRFTMLARDLVLDYINENDIDLE